MKNPKPRQSRRRQHQQQQQQLAVFNEQQKQHARQYQHLSHHLANNTNHKDKKSIMHSIKRSPILKLVAAVAVNVGFVLICQQYWRVAGDDNGAATRGTVGTGVGSMPEQVLVQQHVNQQQQQNPLNQQYAAVVDETPLRTFESQLDFARTSRAERVYKSLFNFLRPVYDSLPGEDSREKERVFVKELAPKRADVDFFLRLEKRLYPFLHLKHRTSFSLQDSYRGKGFVLCAGNNQFKFIVSSIQAIRRLQPDLPIQLFHMGDGDLSRERQEYVREMTNDIEVLDITEFLDNDYMKLGGWSIKAFSLLASRFEEAMLIDSDAYFLQGISTHEQESGVVVINKKTRLNGLLAICKMNSKWERDLHSYKVFYGDKETFWVGFEMVQEPYSFMRTYGGVVGELRDDPVKEIEKLEARLEQEGDGRSEVERQMDRDEIERQKKRPVLEKESVCGAQLHLDYLGQPMWWNGGLMRNKNEGVQRTLDFKYWMAGGGMSLHRERNVRDKELQRELLWDLGKASMDEVEKDEEEGGEDEKDPEWIFYESCMYGGSVHLLEEEKKRLTESFVEMDRVGKEDEAKIWGGKGVDPKEHDWASM
ncbi:hypothetical protein BGZ91_004433 [Linnemannia elongata]|nr:hypothetical protein BGZ91_004433 [Linnemannia elongata]